MNTSNFARLKELFRRAAAGQELTIAFFGRFHHPGQSFHPAR